MAGDPTDDIFRGRFEFNSNVAAELTGAHAGPGIPENLPEGFEPALTIHIRTADRYQVLTFDRRSARRIFHVAAHALSVSPQLLQAIKDV